ncbi:MAG: hypothetical protein JSV04_15015 [Candidatus Heimdallarchaeota archaeon]|nr:MAG: hypothetical protein JSV04_15015 [Candidatus Heimdallarchaeota archaeon]
MSANGFRFTSDLPTDTRKWLIWFFLKTNLVIFALFLMVESLITSSVLLGVIATLLLCIGGLLVYRDIQSDPFHILKMLKVQAILWWRLSGPVISRKPYKNHFPEGYLLQQHDLVRTINVKQKDLDQGAVLMVKVKIAQICPECGGKRTKPITVQVECSHCQNGRQLYSINSMVIPIPCNHCQGIGWRPVHPCPRCKGKGSVWKHQKIRVQIPPSTSAGSKLRIPVLGKVDPKTLEQGDLHLKLRKKMLNLF